MECGQVFSESSAYPVCEHVASVEVWERAAEDLEHDFQSAMEFVDRPNPYFYLGQQGMDNGRLMAELISILFRPTRHPVATFREHPLNIS